MELALYILIYFCTLYFIINPIVLNTKQFFIFWITITMFLSVVIRTKIDLSDFSDMSIYARFMQFDELPISLGREFIFFLGCKYLFNLFGNPITVFIVVDFITYIFLFNGLLQIRKSFFPDINSNNINYIYFAILLFFPFVLGFHTTWRQLISTVVFLNAFGYFGAKKYFKGALFFLVSVFIHNATVYFLPIMLFIINKPITKTLTTITLLIVIYMNLDISTRSNEILIRDYTTNVEGFAVTLMYIISFLSILGFVTISEFFLKIVSKKYFFWIVLILVSIYFSTLGSFSSGVSQRVAFLFLLFLFPIVGYYIEPNFMQKKFTKIIFFHITLFPLIYVHNSTIDLTPLW